MIDHRDVPVALRSVRALAQRIANLKGPLVLDGQIPPRSYSNRVGSVNINNDTALRHSAVWACLSLRAGLISTFPLDVYRRIPGQPDVEVTTPEILVNPGGQRWPLVHWMWATQFDLDRCGNAFGIITERTMNGLPARIDLQAAATATVRRKDGILKYKFGASRWYAEDEVWHERANPVPGLDVGLSPTMYAAWTIGTGLSMQDFALQWFGNGGLPKARLGHTAKKLNVKEARIVKDRYNASVSHGDIFVHGNDWEYNIMQAQTMGVEWLEGQRFSLEECCRFYGVPTDLIDATAGVGSNIKYANITQQHLKFLVLRLHSAVVFRETALSTLTAQPRFVKLNTDSILRMDPLQRAQYMAGMVNARLMTNAEARAKDDNPPLTAAQKAEFIEIYGPPKAPPKAGGTDPGSGGGDDGGGDSGGGHQ